MALFYLFIGLVTGGSLMEAEVTLPVFAAFVYSGIFLFISLNILIEYQEILMSPVDADVLFWRPVPSRTIFVAKLLNLCFYVTLITLALAFFPTVFVMFREGLNPIAGGFLFLCGALLNALSATGLTVVIYAVLLRYVSSERLQDILAYVQVLLFMIVFVGYQMVGPLLEKLVSGEETSFAVFDYVPPGWYAAIPALAETGLTSRVLIPLALGGSFLLVASWIAILRLSPAYLERISSVGTAAGTRAPGETTRRSPLARAFARLFVREPIRRAGFEFFMANLVGDRKIKVALLPIVAMPVAFAIFGWITSGGVDPYDLPPAESEPLTGTRFSSSFSFFLAAYMLCIFLLTLTRAVTASTSWKAAWVFYASPLRHFDRFYVGCLLGVVYGLVLPATAMLFIVMLFVWGDPFHVLLHLGVSSAMGFVVFPAGMLFGEVVPPFSREPNRGGKSLDMMIGFLGMPPLFLVGILHYSLRHNLSGLILLISSLLFLGWGLWLVAKRRFRAGIRVSAAG